MPTVKEHYEIAGSLLENSCKESGSWKQVCPDTVHALYEYGEQGSWARDLADKLRDKYFAD